MRSDRKTADATSTSRASNGGDTRVEGSRGHFAGHTARPQLAKADTAFRRIRWSTAALDLQALSWDRVPEQALDAHMRSWLDVKLRTRRDAEIERARALL
jgi:hypothetical protein